MDNARQLAAGLLIKPVKIKVKLVNFPETKVAEIEHKGSPAREHESIKKLIAWRIENKLAPDKYKTYGVHYNDPASTDPEAYRLDLCISVDHELAPNVQNVVNKLIPAGRCAAARHLVSRDNVTAAAYLYEVWLVSSGEKLRDYPVFFHYVNVGPDVQVKDMITDVYLPIE